MYFKSKTGHMAQIHQHGTQWTSPSVGDLTEAFV